MRRVRIAGLVAALLQSAALAADGGNTARVTGQRVNIRSRADLNAEVVGQLQDGDSVRFKSVQGDWVEIAPPETIDLWVNKDMVVGSRICVDKANVRAGPGINHSVVGTLRRDDTIAAKGSFGEWLRIAPFDTVSLWVSRDLLVMPPRPPEAEPAAPAPAPAKAEAPSDDAAQPSGVPAVPPPPDLRLQPVEGQGEVTSFSGRLRPSGMFFGGPASFRLIRAAGRSQEVVCHVRGNRDQLKGLVDREMTVSGPAFWVERVTEPVVLVQRIQLLEAPSLP